MQKHQQGAQCATPLRASKRKQNMVEQRVPTCAEMYKKSKQLQRRCHRNGLVVDVLLTISKPRPPCLPQIMGSKFKKDIVGICNHIVMTRHTKKQEQKKRKVSEPPPKSSDIDCRVRCDADNGRVSVR
jgi:hypothetical protein